jgi:hypothetical protein
VHNRLKKRFESRFSERVDAVKISFCKKYCKCFQVQIRHFGKKYQTSKHRSRVNFSLDPSRTFFAAGTASGGGKP